MAMKLPLTLVKNRRDSGEYIPPLNSLRPSVRIAYGTTDQFFEKVRKLGLSPTIKPVETPEAYVPPEETIRVISPGVLPTNLTVRGEKLRTLITGLSSIVSGKPSA